MMRILCLSVLLGITSSVPAFGQQIAVQQPIVGITSVTTSVAVPDRGRMVLGGVSSSQSGRSRFGYGPLNSNLGLSRSASSMSVGVTILDLREMDEAILSSASDHVEPSSPFARHAAAIDAARQERPREPNREVESTVERAAKFERLAHKAEAENRPGVAKLHWKMAAKYGSVMARERLVLSSR